MTHSDSGALAKPASEDGGELRAQITPFSSVVGQSVLLTDESGAAVAQLSISIPDPSKPYRETAEEIARVIELAINHPPSEEVNRLRVRLGNLMVEDAKRMANALAKPASEPAGVRRTGAGMIERHRFRLDADNNTAEIDSNGLAEEIDAALSSSATPAVAMPSREWFRDKIASDPDDDEGEARPAPAVEPVAQYRWRDYGTNDWSPWFEGPLPEGCEIETRTLYDHPAPATVESARALPYLVHLARQRWDGNWSYTFEELAERWLAGQFHNDAAESDAKAAALAPATEGRKG